MENRRGFSGWTMVGVCWLVGFLVGAPWSFGVSILTPPMAKSLHLNATQVGMGLSTVWVVSALGCLLTAWLIHRIGIRRTMTSGLVLLVIGFALLGSVASGFPGYMLAFGGLAALGFVMAGFLPMQSLISAWFARNRGTATSVTFSGMGLGGLVWAIIVSRLLQANHSWRAIVFVFAAVGLLSAVLTAIFVRNAPGEVGQLPDGGPAGEVVGTRRTYQTKVQWDTKDVFRTPAYWLILAGATFVQAAAVPTILGFQGLAMASARIPLPTAGLIVGGLGIFMLIGNLVVGPISDRIDNRRVFALVIGFAIVGLGFFTVLKPATVHYAPILYVVLFGTGAGSTYVLAPVMLANYFGHKNYASFTAVAGVFMAAVGLVFPTITGHIFDTTKSYNAAWYLIMGLLAVGIVCICLAAPPKPKSIAIEEGEWTDRARTATARV